MAGDVVLTGLKVAGEETFEESLRPRKLDEFIGQDKLKDNLGVFVRAARQREEALDHVLFSGPPGLGKTTLAFIIAAEMGAPVRVVAGPSVERPGDLAAVLTNIEPGGILFIDEIHRLHPGVEELLYSAMEDYRLDVVIGEGPAARTMKITLPRFTLVGATTRAGLITPPLHGRFGIILRMDYYDPENLRRIVERTGRILKVEIEGEAGAEIARRARGTPRVANRLVRRVRDFVQVDGHPAITGALARRALEAMDVDEYGLEEMDRRILQVIVDRFGGGPVGLKSLASSVGEDKGTLEDLYEPFLVQAGFLVRTPRGRAATPLAYRHLGLKAPMGMGQQTLE
jgi:Holliday junction DNA helicase RuvB